MRDLTPEATHLFSSPADSIPALRNFPERWQDRRAANGWAEWRRKDSRLSEQQGIWGATSRTRALPKYIPNTVTGYMARGGGRGARGNGFVAGTLDEFYGKGLIQGSADFSVCYGPPDGPAVRRLRVSIDLKLFFPKDGVVKPAEGLALGYGDNILSEIDEAV